MQIELQGRHELKLDRHGNIENLKETEPFSISDLSFPLVTSSATDKTLFNPSATHTQAT
jgi:hypothetical protein